MLTRSAGKRMRARHEWFCFYFWLDEKVARFLSQSCGVTILNQCLPVTFRHSSENGSNQNNILLAKQPVALWITWLIPRFHSDGAYLHVSSYSFIPQFATKVIGRCSFMPIHMFRNRPLVFRIHVLGVCSLYYNSRISNETLAILSIVIFLWDSCPMFLRYAPFFPRSDEEGPLENQETLQWSVLEEEPNKSQGCEAAQRCGSILVTNYK